IKDFIRRNTPTRPNLKVRRVRGEKERQRLENLRKKQEAEEQRKKKVEEEKRRRQAEMKQKREERLRKALQARERVEQMEEKKKKRVEQKILQSGEKVREEKAAEERSKRKTSKKHGEAEARKHKALRGGVFLLLLQEENEQQEPLQKRREDEVKERGKKVLELKNLLEQQQLGQAKERCELAQEAVRWDPKQRGKERPPQAQLEPAALAGKATKVGLEEGECGLQRAGLDPSRARHGFIGERSAAAGRGEAAPPTSSPWHTAGQSPQALWGSGGRPTHGSAASLAHRCSLWFQKSLSTSCLGSLKGAQGPGSPPACENSYGLDLNSDDSTDDESNPRKPIPAWADGAQLQQAVVQQYYHPVDVDALFGAIPSPRLEHIFYKSKPRYFKRTSSAVWHSPP
ncbi:INCE protein, partial [Dryoscopus gambensis]|nr:INCE protein [Dryoscopus gambensis]